MTTTPAGDRSKSMEVTVSAESADQLVTFNVTEDSSSRGG